MLNNCRTALHLQTQHISEPHCASYWKLSMQKESVSVTSASMCSPISHIHTDCIMILRWMAHLDTPARSRNSAARGAAIRVTRRLRQKRVGRTALPVSTCI